MKVKQAVSLACECIDKEIQKISVDANFCDLYGATYPHALNSSARRKMLREARAILAGIAEPAAGLPLFEIKR